LTQVIAPDHPGLPRPMALHGSPFPSPSPTPASNSAEDFSPRSHHHLGADFSRRRAFCRDNSRYRHRFSFIEKLFHLVVDGVLLGLRIRTLKACSLTWHVFYLLLQTFFSSLCHHLLQCTAQRNQAVDVVHR